MAKSTCRRCNAEVKQHASKCWNCGNVSPTYSGKKKAMLFIGCLLAISLGLSTCDNKENLKTHQSAATQQQP
ncbi:hypothetical protein [Photobacterium angustum]|uniref:Uncharacterized protein n=1 Tax=Photobacterium angustum TaxID=661 RepID=A0A855SK90_PHOAN|nr:hypothetical protein [Photobacterium angustum]KJF83580.1 hypothetical protein UB36_03360 [Photobacterium damselae subsp. damselae]KJG42555.1 hypothetical protein UA35_00700 [Photobacterium angustum]KJG47888.1 hypothetical protein UA31_03360 [Photobacterium angustum]KJG49854.1 hypothetical protein UA30_04830 [Photobacterium angustum]KJG54053.1 hypothetical protein UA34_07320 [Photobacterium angustum]